MTQKQFLLSMLLAIAFTFSCSDSDGGGGGGGGSSITEAYSLTIDGESFTYVEKEEWYECEEDGKLESYSYDRKHTVNYSIENNVLEWEMYGDTLNFAGTSNNLIGTWKRTKNKETSCELKTYYGEQWYSCKEGWDITEAEFTTSTVKIMRDYCATDTDVDGSVLNGWTIKIIDCNAGEYKKGSETIKIQVTQSSYTITYNGKTCSYNEPSLSQHRTACQKAWTEYSEEGGYLDLQDYYYNYLDGDFDRCIINMNLPEGLFYDESDDSGYFYKSLAKKGAKFSALKKAK